MDILQKFHQNILRETATVMSFLMFLQNSNIEESTSAIQGKSLAIIASFKANASSGVSITILW